LPNGDTEGFGLVFLEANACGKPVLAGRAGGAKDAVIDGVNGLSVDGADIPAIAEALTRLLKDPVLREKLAQGGIEMARSGDWRNRTVEFQNLCQNLTASGLNRKPVTLR
jgi:phosphatidyl-myo-inositol dimannoside synthase